MTKKFGHELEVGDTVEGWTARTTYRITAIREYDGPINREYLTRDGHPPRIAALAGGPLREITLEPFSEWNLA
jgi:hypothetical protein